MIMKMKGTEVKTHCANINWLFYHCEFAGSVELLCESG